MTKTATRHNRTILSTKIIPSFFFSDLLYCFLTAGFLFGFSSTISSSISSLSSNSFSSNSLSSCRSPKEAPHSPQNLASSSILLPQYGQYMNPPPFYLPSNATMVSIFFFSYLLKTDSSKLEDFVVPLYQDFPSKYSFISLFFSKI